MTEPHAPVCRDWPDTEPKHWAKFSKPVLAELAWILPWLEGPIVDPFAGVGRIHNLGRGDTYGIDIEPEYAAGHRRTHVGDALNPDAYPEKVRSIVTSPTYGNRGAGTYLGPQCPECLGSGLQRPKCHTCNGVGHITKGRMGYAIDLGRAPSPQSSALWTFGDKYRGFHRRWLATIARLLPHGEQRLILNMKDHYKTPKTGGPQQRVYVSHWWLGAAHDAGFRLARTIEVGVDGYRQGQNNEARIDHEWIFVFDYPER